MYIMNCLLYSAKKIGPTKSSRRAASDQRTGSNVHGNRAADMKWHCFERLGARLFRQGLGRTAAICVVASQFVILFAAPPAHAQERRLDENCTMSILDRTAQVRPDGLWRIDNVPANFGAVRARAPCVEGRVTLSRQSGLFVVEAGNASAVASRVWDPVSGQVDFKKSACRIERI